MLTYVNMHVLLSWEGAGESVGVGFMNFLAFVQQFQGKPFGGGETAVLPPAAVGETGGRARPPSSLHPLLFSGQ